MLVPSKAMVLGVLDALAGNVPSVAPDGESLVTVLSPVLRIHMSVPSNAIAPGPLPTAKVPSAVPVGESFVTVLSPVLTTHMFVPSKAIAVGLLPTG